VCVLWRCVDVRMMFHHYGGWWMLGKIGRERENLKRACKRAFSNKSKCECVCVYVNVANLKQIKKYMFLKFLLFFELE
jgi:hypothetical protein